MRLTTGPPAPDRGQRTSGTPPSAGVYRLVKGPTVRPDISNGTSGGPASCGPAHLASVTIPPGWSGQQDVTAGILRRYRTHPTAMRVVSNQAAAGLVRAADSRPG